jgi:hypothetical protein
MTRPLDLTDKAVRLAPTPLNGGQMDFDEDKIDEYTLALLYLVTHERHEGFGSRAWKGFDWDTLNRLHKKDTYQTPWARQNRLE